jgi:hypothetical protein
VRGILLYAPNGRRIIVLLAGLAVDLITDKRASCLQGGQTYIETKYFGWWKPYGGMCRDLELGGLMSRAAFRRVRRLHDARYDRVRGGFGRATAFEYGGMRAVDLQSR